MRRIYVHFLILTGFSLTFLPFGRAQGSPVRKTAVTVAAAPTSGFRAEFLEEIAY